MITKAAVNQFIQLLHCLRDNLIVFFCLNLYLLLISINVANFLKSWSRVQSQFVPLAAHLVNSDMRKILYNITDVRAICWAVGHMDNFRAGPVLAAVSLSGLCMNPICPLSVVAFPTWAQGLHLSTSGILKVGSSKRRSPKSIPTSSQRKASMPVCICGTWSVHTSPPAFYLQPLKRFLSFCYCLSFLDIVLSKAIWPHLEI